MVPDSVVMVVEDGKVILELETLRFVMVALVMVSCPMFPLAPRIVEDAVLPIVLAVSVTRFALVPVMVVKFALAPVTVVIDALPPVKVVARRLVMVPLATLAVVMLALP